MTPSSAAARQINVVRALAMDAVLAANSGHTGTATALAPLGHVLFTDVLRYDATDPKWFDRDRLVLSAGHASMLLYAFLSLTGYDVSLDDIEQFRQLGSRTPGHPEVGVTPGVEVTTGPLGQGIANAVGMALAERNLRARLGADLVDHRTYAIAGDGDLMEGISHEAASFAGHQQLGRLTVIYDDNRITIDGATDLTLSDDAEARFAAYGWHTEQLGEASEDLDALAAALDRARLTDDRPTLIIVRSHIGYPLPRSVDTAAAHGAITDADEIAEAKAAMGLDPQGSFEVPAEVASAYAAAGKRGATQRAAWHERVASSGRSAAERSALTGDADADVLSGRDWQSQIGPFDVGSMMATRVASNRTLNALLDEVGSLVVGGADLTGNTGTDIDAERLTAATPGGRKVHYGVREHAMGAIAVGMAHHGGVLPVVGTFLVFADYMRPAVRLAAMSGARVVFVWSHDSIGVGEDGPTHQPVEHLASLRAIPNLTVIRPADANETVQAWEVAITRDGPTALILTRQAVPVLEGTHHASQVACGAYTLIDTPEPSLCLLGTGSELQHCVEAAGLLAADGIGTTVVSMPSWELFAEQPAAYREGVLRPGVKVLAVEAGSSFGWSRYADATITIDRFGASAPGDELMTKFGFTGQRVAAFAREMLT